MPDATTPVGAPLSQERVRELNGVCPECIKNVMVHREAGHDGGHLGVGYSLNACEPIRDSEALVDVHVRLDGIRRRSAVHILEEMLYHARRADNCASWGPGYTGFYAHADASYRANDTTLDEAREAELAQLRADRAVLTARLDEVERDAKRLDWIRDHAECGLTEKADDGTPMLWTFWTPLRKGADWLRDGIDAALARSR